MTIRLYLPIIEIWKNGKIDSKAMKKKAHLATKYFYMTR